MRTLSSSVIAIASVASLALPAQAFARVVPSSVQVSRRTLLQNAYAEDRARLRHARAELVELPKRYENAELGVNIRYPADWELTEVMQRDGNVLLAVAFLSAPALADVSQNVNLVVEDLVQDMNLEAYTRYAIQSEEDFLTSFRLISQENVSLDGRAAKRITFTAETGAAPLKFTQTWFLKDGQAYVWTYADHESTFEDNVPHFDAMLETLTVK